MKLLLTLFATALITTYSFAQSQISKNEMESVFRETLKKARNAVSYATNTWSYDNTNQDYLSKDTIKLNTAREYRRNYCKEIRWTFYENQKMVLENAPECNEPPTILTPKKDDYSDLQCVEKNGNLYLVLRNLKGISNTFRVLELQTNRPLSSGENAFDYTLILERQK